MAYIPRSQLDFVDALMLEFLELISAKTKRDFLELRTLFSFDSKVATKDSVAIQKTFGNIINCANNTDIIKAFTLYHMLLNIIEERATETHINRLEVAFSELLSEGFKREEILSVLKDLEFYPVFTAHPTESRRRTFLEAHHEISQCLKEIFGTEGTLLASNTESIATPKAQKAKQKILYRLRLLWDTHLVRREKIEVLFELDNLLYIIESSIVGASARVLKEAENLLGYAPTKSPIRLGSWVGGDRDGNPYVTNELLTQVARTQHKTAIKLYIEMLDRLIRELSISSDFAKISPRLIASINEQKAHLSPTYATLYASEPIRAKLYLIKKKLKNRLIAVNSLEEIEFCYKSVSELLSDIDMVLESLDSLSATQVAKFRRLVMLGGFHLLQLDFREHRDAFCKALGEIFCLLGYCDSDYILLDEERKIEILNAALSGGAINLNSIAPKLSNASRAIAEAFLRIAWAQRHISPDIIKTAIISMSTKASDILAVLWFVKQSGLWRGFDAVESGADSSLDSSLESNADFGVDSSADCGVASIFIAPLFETIGDLEGAGAIIKELKANPHYARYLRACNNTQEIMIGYSDSSKDGGIFTSNFSLYCAISKLMALQEDLGITFRLFHGRGGSVSRGGGRLEQALLAWAPHSVDGYLKTTEQGEVISSKYLDKQIAIHNLSSALGAMLKKSVYDKFRNTGGVNQGANLGADSAKLLEKISQKSFEVYRNLVYETPGFIEYFRSATPIEFIQRLNLGSRPSKRTNTERVEDLRAIPWVFAWTQNRAIIPGWYGVGSGLMAVEKNALKDAYNSSLFLKGTIDNIAQAFLKVDLKIASLYAQFVSDGAIRSRISEAILCEHEKTLEMLLFVRGENTLLESEGALMEMILIRTPYLSALNLLQVELIKRYKKENSQTERAALMEQIHSTIVGIAQGIRNTG